MNKPRRFRTCRPEEPQWIVRWVCRLRENGTFFEFPLCLSRACLGKIMHFRYKWRKKCRFLTMSGAQKEIAARPLPGCHQTNRFVFRRFACEKKRCVLPRQARDKTAMKVSAKKKDKEARCSFSAPESAPEGPPGCFG